MPLHTQIIITLLTGSLTFCLTLGVAGALIQRSKNSLPPVPIFTGSNFPGVFTKFYTAFFLITFSLASIADCLGQGTESASNQLNAEALPGILTSAAMQILLYLPLVIVYFAQPSPRRTGIGLARKLLWCILGLLLLFLPAALLQILGINDWIIETTSCPAQQNIVDLIQQSDISIKLTLIFMAVIVAPITEECCFRGCLYNILKQYSSPFLAAVASGVLFGAIHISLAQFLQLTIFGIIQCYAYEKARSLWLPIALHMLFNAMSVVILLLCPIP